MKVTQWFNLKENQPIHHGGYETRLDARSSPRKRYFFGGDIWYFDMNKNQSSWFNIYDSAEWRGIAK